jgi:hypothetical protein
MFRRQQSPMTLTLNTGRLSVPDKTLTTDCTILDFTGNGASILVPAGAEIPAMFLLTVDQTKTVYSCTVKWRIRNRIGLALSPNSAG